MSTRAGILVTGTEVLTGRVLDRNGGWISERLRELGVEHEHTVVVGDRPQDMLDALEFLRDSGVGLIVTSGGLGPTADDMTAEIVGRFQGREMVLGVRAEHITIAGDGIPARVLVVEPLGSHALVTVLIGKTPVKVQAPIDVAVRPDQAINLHFDEPTLRWMDAGTGSAIQR